jgi:hypothetical protein
LAEGGQEQGKPGFFDKAVKACKSTFNKENFRACTNKIVERYNKIVTQERIDACKKNIGRACNFCKDKIGDAYKWVAQSVKTYPKIACGIVAGILGGSWLIRYLLKAAAVKKQREEEAVKNQEEKKIEETNKAFLQEYETFLQNRKKEQAGIREKNYRQRQQEKTLKQKEANSEKQALTRMYMSQFDNSNTIKTDAKPEDKKQK